MANEVFRLCSNLQNGTVQIIVPFSRALTYVLYMTYSVHALCSLIPKPKSACLPSLPGQLDQSEIFWYTAWYPGLGLPACSHCLGSLIEVYISALLPGIWVYRSTCLPSLPGKLDQSLHFCYTAWYLGLGLPACPHCLGSLTKVYISAIRPGIRV
jgi:hypothetical protein